MPTIDEAGVKGYDMGYWFAAYVPAKTPAPVVARLNELLARRPEDARREGLLRAPAAASPSPPRRSELAKFQADETQKWGRVIKTAGIEAGMSAPTHR